MKKTTKLLLRFLGKEKYLLGIAIFCSAISVLSTLIAPLVVGAAMDAMPQAGQVRFFLIGKALLLLAVLYVAGSLFQWLLSLVTNRIAYGTVNRMRNAMFLHLTRLPLRFYDRTPHGDTTSRFINDVDAISEGMLQGFIALLQGVLTIVGAIFFMLNLNWPMAVVVTLSAPLAFFVARFITLKSQAQFAEQAKYLGALNGYAEELIQGQKVVKAFCYEEQALERFEEINQKLWSAGLASQFISSLSNPSTRIVNNIAYAAIGVIGGLYAIAGHITVGEVSSFLIYAVIFAKPFSDITAVLTQIQSAAASGERVCSILDESEELPNTTDSITLQKCRGEVQFHKVSFSYHPDRPLIQDFSLHVTPGSRIAIVGQTGAGKTTLVNLLMRFYEITNGSIQIDGVDIRHLTRENLRSQFGMVLQETWLFHGTIFENIVYAKPNADRNEVIQAAKNAGADSFIRKLPQGYDTVISGEGSSLSEGQRQLLTIARVMLEDPPMLILDEATSSIDTHTELRIQKAFSHLMAERTSFVIAHRLSTIQNADQILVMEKGHVVESGTHAELLQKEGDYAKLYYSQFS